MTVFLQKNPYQQSRSRLCAIAISLGLCSGAFSGLQAFAKSDSDAGAKNFLPPVALINDTITLEQLENKSKASDISDDTLGPVVFSAVSPVTVKLSTRPTALQGGINLQSGNDEFETLVDLQQKLDEKDLKHLWEATVEQNPVIRFSLEKLAIPVDLQPKHSSRFLNKTLAVMVNGAAMGAMMMAPGAGAYQNMAVGTVSQAAQNVLLGNNKPQGSTLTATEQIQLAGLIDELKGDLIQNYQGYKKILEQLTQARAVTLRNNNLYAAALKINNPLSRMAAGSAYYKSILNETQLRQQAMLYRLKLERMAGRPAVDHLQLALAVPTPNADVTTAAAKGYKAVTNNSKKSTTLETAAPISTSSAIQAGNDQEIVGPQSPEPFENIQVDNKQVNNLSTKDVYRSTKPPDSLDIQGPQAEPAPLQNTAFLKKSPAIPLEPMAEISPLNMAPVPFGPQPQ